MQTAVVDPQVSAQPKLTWAPQHMNSQKMDQSESLQSAVTRVESQLRYYVQKKMVRVSEFFKDFDSLRSGYITSELNNGS